MKNFKFISKTSLLIISGLALFFSANAQLVFDHYKSAADSAHEYDMIYNVKRKRIRINAYGISDDDVNPAGFLFKSKDLSEFYNTFKEARNKYSEWKKIAELHDVNDMRKNIPLSYKANLYFEHNGKEIINTVRCKFQFVDSLINGKRQFRLIFYSGSIKLVKRTSNQNKSVSYEWVPEFTTGIASLGQIASAISYQNEVLYFFKGIAISFKNESDIDNFLAKVTPERLKDMKKFKAELMEKGRIKQEKENLFK